MAEVKVLHDREGKTLTVWFGEARDEHVFGFNRFAPMELSLGKNGDLS